MPILDVTAPLLKRLAMLALCLALSRIGNVIFLPSLNLEAVGAALSSGQPLTPACMVLYAVATVYRSLHDINMTAATSCICQAASFAITRFAARTCAPCFIT